MAETQCPSVQGPEQSALAGTHQDEKEHQISVLIHSKSPWKTLFLPVTHTHTGVTTSRVYGCRSFKNQNQNVTVQPQATSSSIRNKIPTKWTCCRKTKHKGSFKDTGMQMKSLRRFILSRERELDWCGGHTGFVVECKRGHSWVVAGGEQIWLRGAESSHDFKVQSGEIVIASSNNKTRFGIGLGTNLQRYKQTKKVQKACTLMMFYAWLIDCQIIDPKEKPIVTLEMNIFYIWCTSKITDDKHHIRTWKVIYFSHCPQNL